jgi:hypothetical protein
VRLRVAVQQQQGRALAATAEPQRLAIGVARLLDETLEYGGCSFLRSAA